MSTGPKKYRLEELERRWLLSADPLGLLAEGFEEEPVVPIVQIEDEAERSKTRGESQATEVAADDPPYLSLPLSFESNQGQTDGRVDFLARGSGYTVFLSNGDATLSLAGESGGAVLRLELEGRHDGAPARGIDALEARAHYLTGDDPGDWVRDVESYQSVRYAEVYDGIDIHYYGDVRRLEYDFIVQAGADPGEIRFSLAGADEVHVGESGELVIGIGDAEVRFLAPFAYQEDAKGDLEAVASRYEVDDDGTIGFVLDSYDTSRELVIDPILDFATYLGGTGQDEAFAVAAGDDGSAYVTGSTTGAAFPTTTGPFGAGHAASDVFVARLSADGSSLLYATYVGGAGAETGHGIAVDDSGRIYVGGETTSAAFPTTVGAADETLSGGQDGFVFRLSASGDSIEYSTFLGGDSADTVAGIAIDGLGNVYATGDTGSATGFPTTLGAYDTTYGGSNDAFVVKIDPTGSNFVYGTYLGGSAFDSIEGIAVDASGNVVVGGSTFSGDLGVTASAYSGTLSGATDAFVIQLSADGSSAPYVSYFGGAGLDDIDDVALDAGGRVYVVGRTATDPTPLPTTPGAHDETANGSDDAFLSIFDLTQTGVDSLSYSTFLGGTGADFAHGVAIDSFGRAWLTGTTASTDLGTTANADQSTHGGGTWDAFAALIDPLATGVTDLEYLSYLGGSADETGRSVAVDGSNRTFVVGETLSTDFGATTGAYSELLSGTQDAFVAKLVEPNDPPVNSVPGPQSTPQDTALEFSTGAGNAIGVSDSDAGDRELEVTLSVHDGTLTLNLAGALAPEAVGNTIGGIAQPSSQQIALAPDGSYVLVWRDWLSDGDNYGVWMRRYDANGNPLAGQQLVNTTTTSAQNAPDIAMDALGNFVIVWRSLDQEGGAGNNTWGVYAQRFLANGSPNGGEFRVNSTISGDQDAPSVAINATGDFVVAWHGNGGGDGDGIYIQRYDSTGAAVGGETQVNTTATDIQSFADVAMDNSGAFVVVWTSAGQVDVTTEIYGQRFDATGTPVGGEFLVNTTTGGEQTTPSVDMDADGDFVVSWLSDDGDTKGAYVRHYDASGTARGDEFLAGEVTGLGGEPVDVSMDSVGNSIVVWQNDGGSFGRHFDALGNAVGPAFIVNSNTASPVVDLADSGRFVVGSKSSDVYQQRFERVDYAVSSGTGSQDETVTIQATQQDLALILDGLIYTPNAGFNGVDTLTMSTDDLGHVGAPGPMVDVDTVLITVGNANAPVVDLNGAGVGRDFATTWTEGGGDVLVADSTATLSDPDTDVVSFAVELTNNLDGASEELLADVSGTGLIATWDVPSATLTVSGVGTTAEFEQVMRTVQYRNVSVNPDATARAISFTGADAVGNGNTATTTLTIVAINASPVNTVPGAQATAQDTPLTFSTGDGNLIRVSDAELDGTNGLMELTLSVDTGTLTLNPFLQDGAAVQVNDTAVGAEDEADADYAPDGSFVVVWSATDADFTGIYFERFDSNGNSISAETLVNTTTTDIQTEPNVAIAEDGSFVVVWASLNQDKNGGYGVFARMYDAGGQSPHGRDPGQYDDQCRSGACRSRNRPGWRLRSRMGRRQLRHLLPSLRRQRRQGRFRAPGQHVHEQRSTGAFDRGRRQRKLRRRLEFYRPGRTLDRLRSVRATDRHEQQSGRPRIPAAGVLQGTPARRGDGPRRKLPRDLDRHCRCRSRRGPVVRRGRYTNRIGVPDQRDRGRGEPTVLHLDQLVR